MQGTKPAGSSAHPALDETKEVRMGLGPQALRAGRIEADIDDAGWRSPHFPFIAHIGEYADALSSLLDVDSAIGA